jgi:hypothetical protein
MEFCVNALFYIAKLIQLSYLNLLYEVFIYLFISTLNIVYSLSVLKAFTESKFRVA